MKYKNFSYCFSIIGFLVLISCQQEIELETNVRPLADTIGFAQYDWQMDSILNRIYRTQNEYPDIDRENTETVSKVLISPHDDYSYVGSLYPQTLQNIKANTVFLFGVAHKARLLNLEDQIIFDSYDAWKGPYGNVKVSKVREEILELLPIEIFQVNDSMQRMEHSVEAIIPFLQYYNRNVEIVSILVPYMSYDKMMEISKPLSDAIKNVITKRNWTWGKDYAFVISNDAVHYGDEDWGGKNFAYYGTDSIGYLQTMAHEEKIIEAISGELSPKKVKMFTEFTVEELDHKEYKWTWCGRYSVPFGLLTAYQLQQNLDSDPLVGKPIGYATSIDHPHIPVEDLNMGVTAPANGHHWVGYASINYE